jgi:hypothetical protein
MCLVNYLHSFYEYNVKNYGVCDDSRSYLPLNPTQMWHDPSDRKKF